MQARRATALLPSLPPGPAHVAADNGAVVGHGRRRREGRHDCGWGDKRKMNERRSGGAAHARVNLLSRLAGAVWPRPARFLLTRRGGHLRHHLGRASGHCAGGGCMGASGEGARWVVEHWARRSAGATRHRRPSQQLPRSAHPALTTREGEAVAWQGKRGRRSQSGVRGAAENERTRLAPAVAKPPRARRRTAPSRTSGSPPPSLTGHHAGLGHAGLHHARLHHAGLAHARLGHVAIAGHAAGRSGVAGGGAGHHAGHAAGRAGERHDARGQAGGGVGLRGGRRGRGLAGGLAAAGGGGGGGLAAAGGGRRGRGRRGRGGLAAGRLGVGRRGCGGVGGVGGRAAREELAARAAAAAGGAARRSSARMPGWAAVQTSGRAVQPRPQCAGGRGARPRPREGPFALAVPLVTPAATRGGQPQGSHRPRDRPYEQLAHLGRPAPGRRGTAPA
jgi:hypothetical protein